MRKGAPRDLSNRSKCGPVPNLAFDRGSIHQIDATVTVNVYLPPSYRRALPKVLEAHKKNKRQKGIK